MSDIAHFFSPINFLPENYGEESFARNFSINAGNFPDLENTDIAIIGVCEDRLAISNKGSASAPNEVRKHLYSLFAGSFTPRVVDLGNIMPGHTESDTFYALSETVEFLVKQNIIPVIIGGSQDLTFAQFKGYERLEQTINIVSVDSTFDIGSAESELNNKTFLGKIILQQPNYLFNYSNVGYQTYLV